MKICGRVVLRTALAVGLLGGQVLAAVPADAFCGFYVARADSKLFNKASKVVLTWDEGVMATTMASDYQGDPKEFAVVIPVPTFLERKQIGVVEMATIDHLDAYTAPRLVEYKDDNPCREPERAVTAKGSAPMAMAVPSPIGSQPRYKGVTIEARYDVAEYDVLILSAEESDGLVNWLTDNGYRIPEGAGEVLGSYIKQKMRFFVAKVNLERMSLLGRGFLRPLQVRYTSPKFMLPLRLGTVNANGPQDLVVFALTKRGRVEATNYRTVALPTGMSLPLYIRKDFGAFYQAMFARSVAKEDMRAVFLEYAWNMAWCDPCAADPLTSRELVEVGVRWIENDDARPYRGSSAGAPPVFITRLHVRYDAQHFPEDLVFMETANKENFQGRYVMQLPWPGEARCDAGDHYFDSLPDRFAGEAERLALLTGWQGDDIRTQMEANGQSFDSRAGGIGHFFRGIFGD